MPMKLNPATCKLDMVMGPGSGTATVEVAVDDNTAPGTNPVLPTVAGEITVSGAAVAAHSIPIETHSRAVNAFNVEVQVGSTNVGAPGSKAKAGLVQFDSTAFSVDGDGYVTLLGGGEAIDSFLTDVLGPVAPDLAGEVTVTGTSIFSDGTTANTLTLNVQSTAYTFLLGAGSNVTSTELGPLTNGQLIIGSTGVAPALGSLTSTDSTITVTPGAGTIDLSVTGVSAFTTGSVIFWGVGAFAEDNPNFFWDDSNNRLGIGTATPLDTLHVVGAVDIDHTSVESDDHALELVVDSGSFADVKALDIDYITGDLAAGEESAVMLVNIDEALSTGGTIVGYDVTASSEGSAAIYGYGTGINVNPILHKSGTFGDIDNILNKAVDVTAALASGGAGAISVFVADNDTVTYGDAAIWDEMEIIVTTPASGAGIAPTFEYSTGGAGFSAFIPIDGTNGLRNSGEVSWESGDLAGWATNASGLFEIRHTRTRNTLSTTPILNEVQLSASTEFIWDKNGDVNLNSLTLVVPLAATSGGTGQNLYAVGDILYANSTTTLTQLVVGSNTEVLTLAGGIPSWAAPTVGVVTSITGGPGITVTGTAAVPIINSVVYTDQPVQITVISDSGSFMTNAGNIILDLPSTPAQGELLEIVCTTAFLVAVDVPVGDFIRIGSLITSSGGTATSTAIGDSLTLRFSFADQVWYAISVVGVWVMA